MEKVLEQIKQGKFKQPPRKKEKAARVVSKEIENKKKWYKIGKVIERGHKVELTKRSIYAAKRAYLYYRINKGNWDGPSARKFSFMKVEEFNQHLDSRTSESSALDMTLDEAMSLYELNDEI